MSCLVYERDRESGHLSKISGRNASSGWQTEKDGHPDHLCSSPPRSSKTQTLDWSWRITNFPLPLTANHQKAALAD